MGKLCQTFHLPYSLHKTPYCFTLPLSQCVLQSNFRKHLLFSGSSCAESLFQQKPLFSAPLYSQQWDHFIALNLSTIPSCWTKLWLSMKILLLLTKSPYGRKFCFLVCFLSFFRFCFLTYWDHYCKFAGCDSLILQNKKIDVKNLPKISE